MKVGRGSIITLACAVLACLGCHDKGGSPTPKSSARSGVISHGHAMADEALANEPVDYVEYRLQPELGLVSIELGSVEAPRAAERVRKSAEALARKGILVCTGDAPRAVYRSGTFNGHRIDTLIVALPPDPDEPETGWSRWLLMNVDGRPKVECSLGDAGSEENLFVYGVQLYPEDHALWFSATDSDGNELVVPEAVCSLDDDTLITNESFEEPAEEESGPLGSVLI